MAKLRTLSILALLLFFTLSYAARPEPFPMKTQVMEVGDQENIMVDEVSCEGVDKEECLARRTLAAHLDYIYTQKGKGRRHP